MKIIKRMMASVLLVSSFIAWAPVLAADPTLSAEESVDSYISALLVRIEEIQPLYEDDRVQYFSEVELVLASFVDFQAVARGVMAKYGTGDNGARPEQLARFAEVFKGSLVEFYGSALASYQGGKFEFLENRREPKNPEVTTNVRMQINGNDGSTVEVQYVMFLNEARIWKLKNLYVEGINLRRQYYSRFDNLMSNNNYDIDAVIDRW